MAFLGSPMGRGVMLVSLALIRYSWYRVMRTNYRRNIQVKQDTTNMLAATTAAANIREKVKMKNGSHKCQFYKILCLQIKGKRLINEMAKLEKNFNETN